MSGVIGVGEEEFKQRKPLWIEIWEQAARVVHCANLNNHIRRFYIKHLLKHEFQDNLSTNEAFMKVLRLEVILNKTFKL